MTPAMSLFFVALVMMLPASGFGFSLNFRNRRFAPIRQTMNHPFFRHRIKASASGDLLYNNNNSNKTNNQALQKAQDMKRKAKELMAEARAMEVELRETRSVNQRNVTRDQDDLIEKLFATEKNETVLANQLRAERWSPEKLLVVVEGMFVRLRRSMGKPSVAKPRSLEGSFVIGDTSQSAETNDDEMMKLTLDLVTLFKATKLLDDETIEGKLEGNSRWTGRVSTTLDSRLRELQRGAEIKGTKEAKKDAISTFTKRTLSTKGDEKQPSFLTPPPLWLPLPMTYYFNDAQQPVDEELQSSDLTTIRDEILKGSDFDCISMETSETSAAFTVSLPKLNEESAANYTSQAFQRVQDRMNETGVSERLQLFFTENPSRRGKLMILAVPVSVSPTPATTNPLTLAFFWLGTITTTFFYATSCYALNPTYFDAVMMQNADSSMLLSFLPMFLGIVAVHAVHEVAHFLVAKQRNTRLGTILPVPSPQLGTLGSFTSFLSFPENRDALFDISVGGPVAGMLASMACIVGGLGATLSATAEQLTRFPVIQVAYLKGSTLVGAAISVLAPKLLLLPNSQPIPLHPMFCVGFVGLIAHALNMLPVVGLDGGRCLMAIVGRSPAFIASVGSAICLTCAMRDAFPLFWFGLLYWMSGVARKPLLIRDEISPVGEGRVGAYLVTFFIAIAALTPFPGGLGML